jgi:hypothetical protein
MKTTNRQRNINANAAALTALGTDWTNGDAMEAAAKWWNCGLNANDIAEWGAIGATSPEFVEHISCYLTPAQCQLAEQRLIACDSADAYEFGSPIAQACKGTWSRDVRFAIGMFSPLVKLAK